MAFGMDQAEGAVNGIIGQGMNLIFGKAQDKRQLRQQKKLQDLQINGQKDLTSFTNEEQRKLQMQMWNDTNMPAQVEQAKKAGMSISQLYGGTGVSGATTGGGGGSGSVSGGSAGDPNAGVGMGLQMASQLALMKAQKENIEADTANKKAGAGGTNLDTEIKAETREDNVRKIKEEANKTASDASIKANEETLSNLTMQEQKRKIIAETIGAELENDKTRTGINVDKAKIEEIANNIAQKWKAMELEAKGQELSRENVEKMTKTMLWSAGINAAGNVVKSITDALMKNKFEKRNVETNRQTESRNGRSWTTETRTHY